MRNCAVALLVALSGLLLPAPVSAEVLELSVELPAPRVWRDALGFSHVSLPGYRPVGLPGAPALPARSLLVLVPPGHRAASVELVPVETRRIPGVHQIYPVQRQYPQSYSGPRPFTEPEPALYVNHPIRRRLGGAARPATWSKRGFQLVPVRVEPVAYEPAAGRLSYAARLSVTVTTALGERPGPRARHRGLERDVAAVRPLVANPAAFARYARTAAPAPDEHRYVVVTSEALAACAGEHSLDTLLAEKNARGITTRVATMAAIRAGYAGEDDAARVRAFAREMYDDHDAEYLLLVGDADLELKGGETEPVIVPVRGLWGDVDFGGEELNMPSDLYYAALDGDFNADQDSVFGEETDDADVLAELTVGRVPADSCEEVSNFVRKTLAYREASGPYLEDVWMAGEWINEYATGRDLLDPLVTGSHEAGIWLHGFADNPFFAVHTLYDADLGGKDGWGGAEILDLMNGSVHILNHAGHSGNNYNMRITCDQLDAGIANTEYFFQYTTGCYPGAFDNRQDPLYSNNEVTPQDSFTEHLVLGEQGAFAAVSFSRFGVGDLLPRTFWDGAFGQGLKQLGRLHEHSRELGAGWIDDRFVRWQVYSLNLFGDPELPLKMSGSADPVLGLPAGPVYFYGLTKGESPPDQVIVVRNDGGGTLEWSASSDQEWLTLTPESGAAPGTMTLSADAAGLSQGTYTATVTVTAAAASNSPQTLDVQLYVVNIPGADVPHTATPPVVDGTIAPDEYEGAAYVDLGLSAPGVSWARLWHDNDTLFVSFEVDGDPGDDGDDAVLLQLDSDDDDRFPDSPGDDGQYYVLADGSVLFIPFYSQGDGYLLGDMEYEAPGVESACDMVMGRRIVEIAIDLSQSHLVLEPGESFGLFIMVVDKLNSSAGLIGAWPQFQPELDAKYFGGVTLELERDAVFVEPESLAFSGQAGEAQTGPLTLSIDATLDEDLDFTLTASEAWIVLAEDQGATPAAIEVRADPALLAVGEYAGTVTVLAPDAVNSPLTVPVSFRVAEPDPVFECEPASLSFEMVEGENTPEPQAVSITNAGGGELQWSAMAAGGWLDLSESSGTAPSTLHVGLAVEDIAPGSYSGLVLLTAPGAAPVQVAVILTVVRGSSGGDRTSCGAAGPGGAVLALVLLALIVLRWRNRGL